jgi:hypothetical protein
MNTGYGWEEVYKAAMLETDHGKLRNLVQSAKAAIDARLHDLQMDRRGTPEERHAISDALAGLNFLRRELEKWLRSRHAASRVCQARPSQEINEGSTSEVWAPSSEQENECRSDCTNREIASRRLVEGV